MHLCLTRERTRMGMNFEICSSAQNSCCGIGTHATSNCSLTDNSHCCLQCYPSSCLLIQDIFLVSSAACISTKAEIAFPINCSIQLLKVQLNLQLLPVGPLELQGPLLSPHLCLFRAVGFHWIGFTAFNG